MENVDFMTVLHKAKKETIWLELTTKIFQPQAAELAKKYAFDYWDGDRRINYGGYKYIEGRWKLLLSKCLSITLPKKPRFNIGWERISSFDF